MNIVLSRQFSCCQLGSNQYLFAYSLYRMWLETQFKDMVSTQKLWQILRAVTF